MYICYIQIYYINIYIYILYIYIYIYIYITFVFFVCYNIVATHTHTGHWFHIHIIFSIWFYLIIVTSRNSLPIVNMIQVINKEARAT